MKGLFEKVFIKSESDLPKMEGDYFVHVKEIGIDVYTWRNYSDNDYWLSTFDWYLIPVEPTILDKFIESMTEEDIQRLVEPKWIDCNIKMPDREVLLLTTSKVIILGDWYKDSWRTAQSYWDNGNLKSVYQKEDITHWMSLPEAYFIEPKVVSDEEIEKEFPIDSKTAALTFEYIRTNKAKRIGAKWMRKQLTGE
jgi:hypothetical protein